MQVSPRLSPGPYFPSWHIWKDGKGRKGEGRARGRQLVVPLGPPLPPPSPFCRNSTPASLPALAASPDLPAARSHRSQPARPAPPATSRVESRRGGVRVSHPACPTRPRRDAHAQCSCERASPLPVGVGVYQENIHCRGKGKERTPREVSKRERGIGGNPRHSKQ